MKCDIDCSDLLINSPGLIGVIENDPPSAMFIRYIFEDDERQYRLPCPSRIDIICCRLAQIIDQGLCGFDNVLHVVNISEEQLSQTTIVPSTALTFSSRISTSATSTDSTNSTDELTHPSTTPFLSQTGNHSDTLLISLCFVLGILSVIVIVLLVQSLVLKRQRRRSWRPRRSCAANPHHTETSIVSREQRVYGNDDLANGNANVLV